MEKIKTLIKKVKCTFQKIYDTIKNIKNELVFYKELWDRPEGKKAFVKLFSQWKYLWKKAKPSKLEGKVIFGTGDPAFTGQILGILGVIYGILPKEVSFTPDFEEERYEGKIYAKGKIRLIHVLIIAIRLVLDRNVRIIVKEIMNKEDNENEQQ